MRRLYLRNDWVGYPFRKDYNASPDVNPVRLDSDETLDTAPAYELKDGKVEKHENVLFENDEYVVNIGPQHPATHGVLRFRVSLAGETVQKVDVHCGYIHRRHRKDVRKASLTRKRLALTDRLDLPFRAPEPPCTVHVHRAGDGDRNPGTGAVHPHDHGRAEPSVVAPVVLVMRSCMDLGALTAFFYGFRDREMVLDIDGGDHGRPADPELQRDRRRGCRHPSEP